MKKYCLFKRGLTLLDTADTYGAGHNEALIGKVLQEWHGEVFVATKFGIVRSDDAGFRGVSGKPEYVHQACDASLKRLGVDTIDLYYQHRVDPNVPIEDTVGAMAELVGVGHLSGRGLGEGAVPALIAAQHGERYEDLGGEGDPPTEQLVPTVCRLRQ